MNVREVDHSRYKITESLLKGIQTKVLMKNFYYMSISMKYQFLQLEFPKIIISFWGKYKCGNTWFIQIVKGFHFRAICATKSTQHTVLVAPISFLQKLIDYKLYSYNILYTFEIVCTNK